MISALGSIISGVQAEQAQKDQQDQASSIKSHWDIVRLGLDRISMKTNADPQPDGKVVDLDASEYAVVKGR